MPRLVPSPFGAHDGKVDSPNNNYYTLFAHSFTFNILGIMAQIFMSNNVYGLW